jgi:hypothetical protein
MGLSLSKGEWKIRIERATHVPLTLGGKAKFMIANVLAATLASYLWGFKQKIFVYHCKLYSKCRTNSWANEHF